MTLTVRLLVCWGRRTLYSLLKGYRERRREEGGGRDDRHQAGHYSGHHLGPQSPPHREEAGNIKQFEERTIVDDLEERLVVIGHQCESYLVRPGWSG